MNKRNLWSRLNHLSMALVAGLASLLITILLLPSPTRANNLTTPSTIELHTDQISYPDCPTTPTVIAGYQLWHGLPNHRQPPVYISTNKDEINRHIQAAKKRCITVLAPDWYGPPADLPNNVDRTFINSATLELIHLAEEQNFKVVLMYDEGTLTNVNSSEYTTYTTRVISDLLYAKQNYLTGTAYLTIADHPALFVFPYEGIDELIDWNEVRQQLGISLTLINKDVKPGDSIYANKFDGFYAWVRPTNGQWHPDGLEWGEGYLITEFYKIFSSLTYSNKIMVGGVWPGFDDSLASWGTGRYISRRCGQTWLDTWAITSDYKPPYVLISTWNDFEEGTDIEYGIIKLAANHKNPTILRQSTFITATMSDCPATTYTWDFGDGVTGSGPTISHTYTSTGFYTVAVTGSNPITTLTTTSLVIVSATPWEENFDPLLPSRWVEISAQWEDLIGTTALLWENNPGGGFGKVESEIINADVDAYHILRVVAPAIDSDTSYTIQLLNKNSNETKDVLKDITTPGSYGIDIPNQTGWHGMQSFTINIWISGEGKSITFDLIRLERSIFLPIICKECISP